MAEFYHLNDSMGMPVFQQGVSRAALAGENWPLIELK